MTEQGKIKMLFASIGVVSGWLFGGMINAAWFLYSVTRLGYGEDAPAWYINALGIIRPATIFVCMAVGYMISQRLFRRSQTKGRSSSV